jgi:F-type H+-transporting ATPase subunit gamma
VADVAEYMMSSFRKGEFDRIDVIYNQFKNVATQILMNEQFLPVLPQSTEKKSQDIDYIFQPNQEEILSGLVPKSLKVQLYKAVLDSNASENGARMTAMDKATENAGELLKDLRLTYNRTRQAAITKEILEIVGGAEALKAG